MIKFSFIMQNDDRRLHAICEVPPTIIIRPQVTCHMLARYQTYEKCKPLSVYDDSYMELYSRFTFIVPLKSSSELKDVTCGVVLLINTLQSLTRDS